MCQVFKVSRSGYYDWLKAKPSARVKENEFLMVQVREIFYQSHKTYGSPRVKRELQALGYNASRPRIARLMQVCNLRAVRSKSFKITTDSKHKHPVSPNLLNQCFEVERENQVWVSDITYIKTTKGWLYLTVIIDLYNRKVVGWALSKYMFYHDTVLPAWRMAVAKRCVNKPLIFHSDRGVQYACKEFRKQLEGFNGLISQSMSRKGNCWDNAVAESFFKSLKVECVYRKKYQDQSQASIDIFHWIETWYNRKRRHSALGGLNIEEFENSMLNQPVAA